MILKSNRVAELLDDAESLLQQDPQCYGKDDPERPDPLIIVPRPRFESPLEEIGASSVDLRLGTWFLTLRAAQVPCLKVDGDEELECREAARSVWKDLKTELEVADGPGAAAEDVLCKALMRRFKDEGDDELESREAARSVWKDLKTELEVADGPGIAAENVIRKALVRRQPAPGEAQLAEPHYVPFGGTYILHPGHFVLGVTLEWLRLPRMYAGSVIGKSSWGRRGLIIATATGVHPGFTGCLTLEITNVGEIPIQISPGMLICQLSLYGVDGDYSTDSSMFAGKRKPALGRIRRDKMASRLAHPE
jgi:deoxycytidine triphosphate deaminase